MAHLILDPSIDVAKMSYSLLFRAAQRWTEHLVVEAGVDTSSETAKFEMPSELIQVLEFALQPEDSAEPVSTANQAMHRATNLRLLLEYFRIPARLDNCV